MKKKVTVEIEVLDKKKICCAGSCLGYGISWCRCFQKALKNDKAGRTMRCLACKRSEVAE